MDTTSPNNLLYNDPESRLIIELPSNIRAVRLEKEIAEVLSLLAGTYQLINKYRIKGDIDPLLDYPVGETIAGLYDFLDHVKPKQREAATLAADEIIALYDLSASWGLPFIMATLTHHFPVLKDDVARFHYLPRNVGQGLIDRTKRLLISENSLIIEVRRKTTINELMGFLSVRKDELSKELERVPERPSTKLESRTIFWGYLAEMLTKGKPKSRWDAVLGSIEAILVDSPKLSTAPLTGEDLRLLHRDFIRGVSKFHNR